MSVQLCILTFCPVISVLNKKKNHERQEKKKEIIHMK